MELSTHNSVDGNSGNNSPTNILANLLSTLEQESGVTVRSMISTKSIGVGTDGDLPTTTCQPNSTRSVGVGDNGELLQHIFPARTTQYITKAIQIIESSMKKDYLNDLVKLHEDLKEKHRKYLKETMQKKTQQLQEQLDQANKQIAILTQQLDNQKHQKILPPPPHSNTQHATPSSSSPTPMQPTASSSSSATVTTTPDISGNNTSSSYTSTCSCSSSSSSSSSPPKSTISKPHTARTTASTISITSSEFSSPASSYLPPSRSSSPQPPARSLPHLANHPLNNWSDIYKVSRNKLTRMLQTNTLPPGSSQNKVRALMQEYNKFKNSRRTHNPIFRIPLYNFQQPFWRQEYLKNEELQLPTELSPPIQRKLHRRRQELMKHHTNPLSEEVTQKEITLPLFKEEVNAAIGRALIAMDMDAQHPLH